MIATQSFAPSSEMQMNRRISQASSRRFRRGFTLIELMVVVGIIIILVGLTVGVGVILHEKSEQRQVENTFKILDSAVAEWELEAERQMTWGKNGYAADGTTPSPNATYDIQSNLGGNFQLSQILNLLMANSTCREMLAKIDPSILVQRPPDANGLKYFLVDPWGKDMVAVHPGPKWVPGMPGQPDADGTVRTVQMTGVVAFQCENNMGVCVNRRIRFVSGGPNGGFGKLFETPGTPDYEEAHDNIYSYPLVPQ